MKEDKSKENLKGTDIRFTVPREREVAKFPSLEIKRKKISLCMIVKNEEETLSKCLDSVRSLVDEMIIVDTGSTDKTVQIAESYGAKVFHYKWQNDFGKARNFSLQYATGDWIVIMDGDEVFDSESIWKLRKFIEESNVNNPLSPRIINYIDQHNSTEHFHCRIFPNRFNFAYKGLIHEQLLYQDGSVPEILQLPDIIIYHYGYTKETYEKREKKERNINLLKKQLLKEKKNPFHYYNLQTLHYIDTNYEKSLSYFNSVKKYSKKSEAFLPQSYVLASSSLIYLGKLDKALAVTNEVIKFAPHLPDANFLMAVCHYKLKNYTMALKYCEKALSKDGKPASLVTDSTTSGWKTYHLMGHIFFDLERWSEALDAYLKTLDTSQPDPSLIISIARCYGNLNMPDKAMEYYQKALSMGSDSYPCYIEDMADFIEHFQGINEALNLLDQYLKIFPAHQNINLRKGELLRKKGDYIEAIRFYTVVIEKPDESVKLYEALIYLNRGICYYHSGNQDKAIDDFKEAIHIEPRNINPYVNLGYIYIDKNEPDKAIEYLVKAKEIARDNYTVTLTLAEARIAVENIEEAFALLSEIPPSSKEEFIRAHFMKSDYYMSSNQLQKAYTTIMDLISIYPSEVDVYRYLVRILIAQGNFTTALSMYDCLLKINPEDISILFQKGKILEYLQDFKQAKVTYSRALSIDPYNKEIKESLELISYLT